MQMNFSQAVILAGGRGTRLHPLTDKIPKPMAPINAIPFLDYLINSIIKSEIKNIWFSTMTLKLILEKKQNILVIG